MKKFLAIVQVILIMIIVIFSDVETVLAAPTFVDSMDFNGHHYEIYCESGISWTNAKAYAENMEYNGQPGYLATVTTMAEHNAVAALNPSYADSYLGAIGSVPNSASTWQWATGPEAGQPVMTSRPPWMSGEPNNTYPNEVYLIIRANNLWDNRAVTNKWVSYFIVEYGGLGAASEPSGEKDITSFSVDYQLYSTQISGNTVSVTMTNPSSLSNITPRIVVSNKATISPASETRQNFNDAVHYTVTAEDGSTKEYIVTVLARYTVCFDANGGTGAPSYITGTAGSTITIPSAEPANGGMIFGGWNTAADGTGETYWPDGSMTVPVNGDMLFAQWTEPSYAITYHNVQGASNSNPASYTAGDTPLTLGDLGTRIGYTFDGWYDNAELSGGAIAEIPEGATGAQTFWAKWTQNDYTVYYDGNGNTGGMVPSDNTVYHYQDEVTVSADEPARIGYTFGGWSDGTKTYEAGDTFEMPDGDVTLTALWAINSYTVTFEGNGGSAVSAITRRYGSVLHESDINTPMLRNYQFGGWFIDKELKTPVVFPFTVISDAAWYARWNKIAVESLMLNQTSSSLYVGEAAQLTATVFPADATYPELTWISSNTTVATVDQNGGVSAVKTGTATITVSADGKAATCEVTVKARHTGGRDDEADDDITPSATPTAAPTATPAPAASSKPSASNDDKQSAPGTGDNLPSMTETPDTVVITIDVADLPEGTSAVKLPDGSIIKLDGSDTIQIEVKQSDIGGDGQIELTALDEEDMPLGVYAAGVKTMIVPDAGSVWSSIWPVLKWGLIVIGALGATGFAVYLVFKRRRRD